MQKKEAKKCYRLCWQVKLVFKRIKSLLQFGCIPTKTEEVEEAWINVKILLLLFTEKYLCDIDFPPLGTSVANQSKWEEDKADILFNFYDDTAKYSANQQYQEN